jgi:hypothetical protein
MLDGLRQRDFNREHCGKVTREEPARGVPLTRIRVTSATSADGGMLEDLVARYRPSPRPARPGGEGPERPADGRACARSPGAAGRRGGAAVAGRRMTTADSTS